MEMVLQRQYEPELSDKFRGWLSRGDVYVDVGANMGYFTLLGAKLIGEEGIVLACEPQNGNARRLTCNLERNHIYNVIVQTTAASDQAKLAKLTIPPYFNNGVSSLHPELLGLATKQTPVLKRPIDDILEEADLASRVTLVKIDTEGHEPQVIRGMSRLLARSGRFAVACELSPSWYDVAELVRTMESHGFSGSFYDGGEWRELYAGNLPKIQCNSWFERHNG
jgi:FkbM family methyltransferase